MAGPEGYAKALSDDGSYEFIDHQEADHRISDFEEDFSAARRKRKSMEEYSVVGTDNDSDGDSHSDGSYEFVDSEEVGKRVSQSFVDSEEVGKRVSQSEEDLSSESSDTSADDPNMFIEIPWKETDAGTKKGRIIHFQTVAYEHGVYNDNVYLFPDHIKHKSNMKLKDVVQDHVLPFLPAKSLIKFRAVSKDWDKWIASPFLAHLQSNRFKKISGFFRASPYYCNFFSLDHFAYGVPSVSLSFMPDKRFVIKSSCNGLLLCQGYNGDDYYIVNPTNKEWKKLPEPKYYNPNESKCVLVFDPSPLNFPAHFKVICAITLPYDIPVINFEVYDSVTKSWTLSDVICAELGDTTAISDGFYFNGIAYWQTFENELLALDLKNEICGLQPLPPGTKCIGVLDGEMCFVKADCGPVLEIYTDYLSLKRTIQIGDGSLNDFHILSPVEKDFAATFLDEMKGGNHGLRVNGRYFPYVNSLVSLEHQ